ncbi:hypothetical protein EGR52_07040 [bacterium]|nr:hypothetical protein [bacterium]
MSKLYQTYVALKIQDSSQLYLFKSGIFYIFIDEDAKLISSLFNLKLTNLNSMIVKCGFPTSQLEKYANLFEIANLSFKIIDTLDKTVYSPKEFILDAKLQLFLKKISSVRAYDLSISSAYEFIDTISKESKSLLGEYTKNGKK